jgi:hypothetical protein
MKRIHRLAAVVVLAALLVGCSHLPPGPPGKVDKKSMKYKPATKTRDFFLTVRTKTGKLVKFEVPSKHYGRCYRGSSYPSCTKVDRD